ncbi:hypothetical protein OUZ56_031389 [Daphnia magna]|uniref:Uncharacterized protein n=1 Tax=Daphnia magna TaxID=35525 RepID=A0ABQ9ZU41_9CRUS|nr:hypothetical protein OUZ56_031389 [Daphnia magna]
MNSTCGVKIPSTITTEHSPKTTTTTATTKGNAECGLEERRVKMLWLTTSRQIAADLSLPTV